MRAVAREILLAFWKVHILPHAGSAPLHGFWMLDELAGHGYRVSPGTLYPILRRMERNGWLRASGGGGRARRNYRLTARGRWVLEVIQANVAELHREVVGASPARRRRTHRAKGGR